MKELLYYEIRKWMSIKIFIMTSIVVLLFPMLMALENVTGNRDVDAYKEMYAHEVTADWLHDVEAKYEELRIEEEQIVAASNGAIYYGAALSEEKQNLQNALTTALHTGKNVIEQEYLNRFDHIENGKEEPYAKARADYAKFLYAEKQTYYFGSAMGGDYIITSLWYGGIVLGIYMLYLFSKIFNEEERGQFCDLLKTTKRGKRDVAKVKLCTMLGVSAIFSTVYMGLTFLIAFLFLHPQLHVIFDADIFMTFGEAVFIACVLFVTVLFAFSIIASLLSSLVKSSFVSLAASLLFFMIPIFMQSNEIAGVDVSAFLPSNLILFNNTIYGQPYGFIQGWGYFYHQVMPIFWLVLGSVLCIFIYIKFQRRAHA